MSGNVLTLLYLITLFTSITTPQSPKSILVLIGIPVFRGIPDNRGDRTFFSIRVLQIHGNRIPIIEDPQHDFFTIILVPMDYMLIQTDPPSYSEVMDQLQLTLILLLEIRKYVHTN